MKDTYMTVENGIVDINSLLFSLAGLIENKTDKETEELINKYHSYHMSSEKELWVILAIEDLAKAHVFLCINLTNPYFGTLIEMDSIENVYNWIDNKKFNDIKRINESLHNNDFSTYNYISINIK